ADAPRSEREIVDDAQVREEVELLEHDPDPLAHAGHVDALARDLLAFEEDPARVDRLEQVHAAQQRALAAPARANDDEHLAGRDFEIDSVEDDEVAEALPHTLEPYHRVGGAARRFTNDPCSLPRQTFLPSIARSRQRCNETPQPKSTPRAGA